MPHCPPPPPPRAERKHWHVVSAADVRLRWALTGPKLPLSPPDKARAGWQRAHVVLFWKRHEVIFSFFLFPDLLNQMTRQRVKRSAGGLCWGLLWPKWGPSEDASSLGLKLLLSHPAGSRVRSEPVPELIPVGCVSIIKKDKTWFQSSTKSVLMEEKEGIYV